MNYKAVAEDQNKLILELIMALEFYATPSNHTDFECGATMLTIMEDDQGMRAIDALKKAQADIKVMEANHES